MRRQYRVHRDALPPLEAGVVMEFTRKGQSAKVMTAFSKALSGDLKWKGYAVMGATLQRLSTDKDTRAYTLALMLWSWATTGSLTPPSIPHFRSDDVDRFIADWPDDESEIAAQRQALTVACTMRRREGWSVAQMTSALISPTGLNQFHLGMKTLITASTLEHERSV